MFRSEHSLSILALTRGCLHDERLSNMGAISYMADTTRPSVWARQLQSRRLRLDDC